MCVALERDWELATKATGTPRAKTIAGQGSARSKGLHVEQGLINEGMPSHAGGVRGD